VVNGHKVIFSFLGSVLGDRKVIYLSGPITTGLRWIEATERSREKEARPEIIAANGADILRNAKRLRIEDPMSIVVEPGSFTAEGWSQDDYLELWKDLIERHASEVRFLPDWQYSIGCAKEYAHAVALGVPTSELNGAPLGSDKGVKLLRDALNDLACRCERTPALTPFRQDLAQVVERLIGRL
jgi:hypothetical protein